MKIIARNCQRNAKNGYFYAIDSIACFAIVSIALLGKPHKCLFLCYENHSKKLVRLTYFYGL